MFFKPQPVHFVGIGGIGMSGLAEVLLELGYRVSGSDAKLLPLPNVWPRAGRVIFEGHAAANVAGAKAVVVSSAVRARQSRSDGSAPLGLPVIPRGELLAELMRLKFGIAVAGSHGKTTTTSMVAAVLSHAGLDPTVVVGGRVGMHGRRQRALGQERLSGGRERRERRIVPEACARSSPWSPTSIASTWTTTRTSMPSAHAFAEFVEKVPFYGAAILCLDDENVQQMLPE